MLLLSAFDMRSNALRAGGHSATSRKIWSSARSDNEIAVGAVRAGHGRNSTGSSGMEGFVDPVMTRRSRPNALVRELAHGRQA